MKLPYIPLYTGDWLSDPALGKCSPATRGIWIDAVCAMHEAGRIGRLDGTPEQLARTLRCSVEEFTAAKDELKLTKTADVTERIGKVTLINRRMLREHKEREQTRLRVQRHRRNETVTSPVSETKRESNKPLSYSSSVSSSSSGGEKPPAELQDWQIDKDINRLRTLVRDEEDSCKPNEAILRNYRERLRALRAEVARRGTTKN